MYCKRNPKLINEALKICSIKHRLGIYREHLHWTTMGEIRANCLCWMDLDTKLFDSERTGSVVHSRTELILVGI